MFEQKEVYRHLDQGGRGLGEGEIIIIIENFKLEDGKKNIDSATDITNYSNAQSRSVVIEELLNLKKKLT